MSWESRGVWCKSKESDEPKGWLEIQEGGPDLMRVAMRVGGLSYIVSMTREQARTFAAHMLNLSKEKA